METLDRFDVSPVGATAIGIDTSRPRIVVRRSGGRTPASTR
jgi:hypothetical protein